MREENSKLQMSNYRMESEKKDLEKKIGLSESMESAYGKSFDKSLSDNGFWKSESGGIERLKAESEIFKRSLNEASQSSKFLKDKVKSLKKEYEYDIGEMKKN